MRSRFPIARRGTSLIEGLMASVLLATSVVGISGSVVATYQSQAQLQLQRGASATGRGVMETVTALPMEPATAGGASLSSYQATSSSSSPGSSTVLNVLGVLGVTSSSSGTAVAVSSDPILGGILPNVGVNLVIGGTDASATNTTSNGSRPPSVLVERRAGLTGATSNAGDFALVTVSVPTDGKKAAVRLKRLVTSVEAAANQTK